jgi:hypothetical protein
MRLNGTSERDRGYDPDMDTTSAAAETDAAAEAAALWEESYQGEVLGGLFRPHARPG